MGDIFSTSRGCRENHGDVEWEPHDTEPDRGQLPRKHKQLPLLSRTPAPPPPLPISKKDDSFSQHLLSTLGTKNVYVIPTFNKIESKVSRTFSTLSGELRIVGYLSTLPRGNLLQEACLDSSRRRPASTIFQDYGTTGGSLSSCRLAIYYLNSVSKSLSRANAQLRKKIQAVSLPGGFTQKYVMVLVFANLFCEPSCII